MLVSPSPNTRGVCSAHIRPCYVEIFVFLHSGLLLQLNTGQEQLVLGTSHAPGPSAQLAEGGPSKLQVRWNYLLSIQQHVDESIVSGKISALSVSDSLE
jgi:hypothetical protein